MGTAAHQLRRSACHPRWNGCQQIVGPTKGSTSGAVVGVDAGKFRHCLVVRPRGGKDSKPFLFQTTREGFESAVEYIQRAAGGIPPEEILVGIEFAGVYGFTFAHFLNERGFGLVSVLAAHTKKWKEVVHNQPLKTDPKDAQTIADLVAMGQFVAFPFLKQEYAELRYMVSARESLSTLCAGAVTRLKSGLQVVWPEYEHLFASFNNATPLVLLSKYPGPDEFLSAPRRAVVALLQKHSRGQLGVATYEKLFMSAANTVALASAQGAMKEEVRLLIEQIAVYRRQMKAIEEKMIAVLDTLPEAACLLSIPGVAPVSAAVFLGAVGDPRAYESSRQVIKLAGLSLVERSSGVLKGKERISKRGKPVLRRQAFMLALRAVRSDGMYRDRFLAMVARNGGRKLPAIVALSRDMLRMMFYVARNRRMYTDEPPTQGMKAA